MLGQLRLRFAVAIVCIALPLLAVAADGSVLAQEQPRAYDGPEQAAPTTPETGETGAVCGSSAIANAGMSSGMCEYVDTFTGSITDASPVKTSRLSKADPAGTCVAPIAMKGTFGTGDYHYGTHTFSNESTGNVCYTVEVTTACGVGAYLQVSAYAGAFDPANLSANFLADIGEAPMEPSSKTFSFNAPPGQVVLVANEVYTDTYCASYTLTVRKCACEYSGGIDDNDPVQQGRLLRSDPPSTCAAPTGDPGLADAGSFHYQAHSFVNSSENTVCYTVAANTACTGSNYISMAAYLDSFSPSAIASNYLADIGGSPNPAKAFSFNVPAGRAFVVVASEVTAGAGCPDYEFTLSPCSKNYLYVPLVIR